MLEVLFFPLIVALILYGICKFYLYDFGEESIYYCYGGNQQNWIPTRVVED